MILCKRLAAKATWGWAGAREPGQHKPDTKVEQCPCGQRRLLLTVQLTVQQQMLSGVDKAACLTEPG